MEGLVVDLVVVIIALGGGLAGLGFLRNFYKKEKSKDPDVKTEQMQEQGEKNVKEYELEEARRCGTCNEVTDPNVDLFIDGTWFHKKCFKVN